LNLRRIASQRDVLLLRIGRNRMLAVACDSSGGVGPKKGDSVTVPGQAVGEYAARTVLLELICTGARIMALTVTLSVEYDPIGKQILAGIRKALAQIKSRPPLIFSTEKNFPVGTTGVGVSAIGLLSRGSLKIGRSRAGDLVLLFGQPSVGNKVLRAQRKNMIPTLKNVVSLLHSGLAHDVIPVGSTGVLHEARVIASDSGLRFVPSVDSKELQVSAGPSTALLLSAARSDVDKLKELLDKPLVVIGSLERLRKQAGA